MIVGYARTSTTDQAAGLADQQAKFKAAGKYVGRQPTAMRRADEVKRLHAEGVRPADIARRLKIGRTSVYRALGNVAA